MAEESARASCLSSSRKGARESWRAPLLSRPERRSTCQRRLGRGLHVEPRRSLEHRGFRVPPRGRSRSSTRGQHLRQLRARFRRGSLEQSRELCARERRALSAKSSRGAPVDLLAPGGPDRDLLALQLRFELGSLLLAELPNELHHVTHRRGGGAHPLEHSARASSALCNFISSTQKTASRLANRGDCHSGAVHTCSIAARVMFQCCARTARLAASARSGNLSVGSLSSRSSAPAFLASSANTLGRSSRCFASRISRETPRTS